MNIVVLAGGLSTERDVSLTSGRMVSRALARRGHSVVLLDAFLGYEKNEQDGAGAAAGLDPAALFSGECANPDSGVFDLIGTDTDIPGEAPDLAKVKAMRGDSPDCFFGPNVIRICQAADIVFLGLHGENGENGKVQAAFDLYGIRYTGTGYLSSALAMDKGISKTLFEAAGIPTPHGICMKREEQKTLAETGLSLPSVVKPCCGGSSIGVSIVLTDEEYEAALAEAFRYEDEVIVEDFIEGREFSVGVIGHKALPVIEIAPVEGFYDYQNKYKAGSTVETCPADLPEETTLKMQQISLSVCEVLCLTTYSRMDFLLDENGRIFCLEANTLPGMTPTSLLPQEAAVDGMDFETLCEELVRISLEKYED
ncbi:MAG: D-alanine--D-alanine ligase [Lachnospiraceae bacterium]|nr:D-alanine--D-alanine ligase [Lachnospiraceae bacterium]